MRRTHGVWILALILLEGWARRARWGHLPPAPGDRIRGEVVSAPQGAPTLLVLGDSIPWGYGLPDPRLAWPVRVGEELAARGTRWRVVDVSIPGETSLQGWARWRRDVLPWRPDRVLVAFGLNDCHLQRTAWDVWRWAHLPRGWGRYSRLLHAFRVWRLPPPRPAPPRCLPRLTPEQTGEVLERLVREADRAGVEMGLLTPTPVGAHFHPEWPDAVRAYQMDVCERTRDVIRRVARAHRVPLIDVARSLDPVEDAWLQPDGIHLTAEAHARVAEVVINQITSDE